MPKNEPRSFSNQLKLIKIARHGKADMIPRFLCEAPYAELSYFPEELQQIPWDCFPEKGERRELQPRELAPC